MCWSDLLTEVVYFSQMVIAVCWFAHDKGREKFSNLRESSRLNKFHMPIMNFVLSPDHNDIPPVAWSVAAGLCPDRRRQQLPPWLPLWGGKLWSVWQLQPDQGGLPRVRTQRHHAHPHPTGHCPPRPVLQLHGPTQWLHVNWSRLHHPR